LSEIEDKIQKIEDELAITPSNKGTQGHIGLLKAKIARLKDDLVVRSSQKTDGYGYSVKKSGDATVILLGFPSVGKSTLINNITNADSPVAGYEFTTLNVIPGIMEYEDTHIQILDIPGIIEGASEGKGKGKQVLAVSKMGDIILIIVDVFKTHQLEIIKKELYNAGIRLNEKKPKVRIKKTGIGGILINKTVKLTKINYETIKSILTGFGILNADILIQDDIDDNQLIDCIAGNRNYISMMAVLNKIDLVDNETLNNIKKNISDDLICISADKNLNIEQLKEHIYKRLNFIKIYTKRIGKKPDMKDPIILKKGSTVEDVCLHLHKDFVKTFEYAKIWGDNVRFQGQRKDLNHVLSDKNIVELH